jgi:UMF1 family MFS transporter
MFFRRLDRAVVGWAFYDWANSAFATTVLAGFFPVFFKIYWARDLPVAESTFWLGMVNSVASLVMVLSAPVLGALADQSGRTKQYLGLFCGLGVAASAALFWVPGGSWPLAMFVFLFGAIGFAGGNLYYDALLPRVAHDHALDRVSALGFGLGYLGGGMLFALNVAMVRWPAAFGLGDGTAAVRWSFLTVAVWWAAFSIPLFLWVPGLPDRRVGDFPEGVRIADGVRRVRKTLGEIRAYPQVMWFLLAYWLYIDGVDTVVRMAADYGLAIGLEAADLMTALLVTQFVGFPAALVFGALGQRVGPKRGILVGIFAYLLIVLWAYRMETAAEFYILAVAVGLVQGGVQALSRSLFVRLVPRDRSGEFFGFYNMMGKFAVILGPILVGLVAIASGDNRLSILAVAVLFVAGGAILTRVQPPARPAFRGSEPL